MVGIIEIRKGARSESHEIKGEVFQARVLSVWKEI